MLIPSAVTRAARNAGTLVILSSLVNVAAAQEPVSPAGTWEMRVPSGSFNAIGAQARQLKDAHVTALQLSWVPRRHLAVTGTFAWARSRDLATFGNPKVDVFTSD